MDRWCQIRSMRWKIEIEDDLRKFEGRNHNTKDSTSRENNLKEKKIDNIYIRKE